ncbi:MAG: hypothetical protein IJF87_03755 [Erysipelotrichaceae bacterium]|nr:hypothetical protein [Erysipelotrichaceae bacterium]
MKDPVIRSNRKQCLCALIGATIVAVCVIIGVTMNLVTLHDENFDHMGIQTFCMFTVNSNILAGLSMMFCIPYTIDGLRTGNYHLPDWVVVLMHITVTAVALTFLVSLFILSPVKGFRLIFTGSRFFLHGVCPILSIVTFCFFINSHMIRPWEAEMGLVPVLLYAIVYVIMVVVVGEEHGGWDDFYGFVTRVPAWVSILVILPLTIGISLFLKWAHNACCLARRRKDMKLYRAKYEGKDLREIIAEMARSRKSELRVKNPTIPIQMIGYMIENTGYDMDTKEGAQIYFDTWMENRKD